MAVQTVGRNTRASLIFYEQSDIQTLATGASPGLKVPVIETDIAPKQDLVESEVINATRNPTMPFLDAIELGGGYQAQADPIGIGFYLKWLLGAPVTTGAGPYTHVFTVNPTSPLLALTVERFLADVTTGMRGLGAKFDKMQFDAQRNGLLKLPFTLIGLSDASIVAPLDAAPYAPATNVAFRMAAASMKEAGVAFALANKFHLDFDNQMQGLPVIGNNGMFYDIVEGIGKPKGSFGMYLTNSSIIDKALAGTESSLLLLFNATDGSSSLQFEWPEVKYNAHAFKVSGGTGPVPVDVNFVPYWDNDAGNTSMKVTLINSFASYTAIPA